MLHVCNAFTNRVVPANCSELLAMTEPLLISRISTGVFCQIIIAYLCDYVSLNISLIVSLKFQCFSDIFSVSLCKLFRFRAIYPVNMAVDNCALYGFHIRSTSALAFFFCREVFYTGNLSCDTRRK